MRHRQPEIENWPIWWPASPGPKAASRMDECEIAQDMVATARINVAGKLNINAISASLITLLDGILIGITLVSAVPGHGPRIFARSPVDCLLGRRRPRPAFLLSAA